MRAGWFALFVLVSGTPILTDDNVDDLARRTCAGSLVLPDTSECRLCAELGAPALFACRAACGKRIDPRDLEDLECLRECFERFHTGVAACIEATRSGNDGSNKN